MSEKFLPPLLQQVTHEVQLSFQVFLFQGSLGGTWFSSTAVRFAIGEGLVLHSELTLLDRWARPPSVFWIPLKEPKFLNESLPYSSPLS